MLELQINKCQGNWIKASLLLPAKCDQSGAFRCFPWQLPIDLPLLDLSTFASSVNGIERSRLGLVKD